MLRDCLKNLPLGVPSGNETFPQGCAPQESLMTLRNSLRQIFPDNPYGLSTVCTKFYLFCTFKFLVCTSSIRNLEECKAVAFKLMDFARWWSYPLPHTAPHESSWSQPKYKNSNEVLLA